jgi:hypothetical protein
MAAPAAAAEASGTAVSGFGVTEPGIDGDGDPAAAIAARVGFGVGAGFAVACGLVGAAADVVRCGTASIDTHRPSQAIRIRA